MIESFADEETEKIYRGRASRKLPQTIQNTIVFCEEGKMVDEERLPPIHPGEVLLEDFMKPLGLSQYRVAHDIDKPKIYAIIKAR